MSKIVENFGELDDEYEVQIYSNSYDFVVQICICLITVTAAERN